ncbi:CHAT domain-containing protein [Leptodontidium sp. MPI-SDFR-AT-0119]|nr:CHAT domain-containing protein [Leptodontidium sp. MPI-SDFR-AT-0119]
MQQLSPFNTSIKIKDSFRVLDVLAVNTKVFLVVFSACLNGTSRASDTGDSLGFAHAVLAAGAGTFLGALWEVDNLATMILMHFFYTNIIALPSPSRNSITIAQCWQRAIEAMADSRPEQAAPLIEQILWTWDRMEQEGLEPGKFSKEGKNKLERLLSRAKRPSYADEFDFNHPYFWAPFCLVGDAGQYFMTVLGLGEDSEREMDRLRAEMDNAWPVRRKNV